jgi:hypothetical protein
MGLQAYGFVAVGEWLISTTVQSGITFKLNAFAQERVVYAFVVDEQPKYVGICDKDTTTLRDRMNRYKNRQGGSTNRRIAINIKECLTEGKAVQIFALKPESKFQYVDLKVDLVKGLENLLIAKLKPDWNL